MNETALVNPSIKHLTFKGKFKGSKCRYTAKAISKRFTITDGFHDRFKTTITVYIPKLTPKHQYLRTLLHIVNGAGSCQLRVKDPRDLADQLEEIVNVLRSDTWLDTAFRVESVAEHLIDTGEIPVAWDDDIVDINEYTDAIIDSGVDVKAKHLEDIGKEFLREKGVSGAPD